MPDVSDKVLQDCKDWLIKESGTWQTGVCRGKCVYLDGKHLQEGHQYCHSWVTSGYTAATGVGGWEAWDKEYSKTAQPFLTLSCHSKVRSRTVCSPEACDFLVLWMARESPFKEFILNRDDEKSLTEGGVILLCGPGGLPLAQAMWVCKVLRFITEGGKAADTFMTLVKGGVDGMLAVLVASHVRTIKGTTFGYTGPYGHMSVVSPGYEGGKVSVAGFLSRNLHPRPKNTLSVFSAPKGVTKDVTAPEAKIKGFCKPFKKPDGWGGFITGEGADAESLVNHVLEWEKELKETLKPPTMVERVVAAAKKKMPNKDTVYLDLDL